MERVIGMKKREEKRNQTIFEATEEEKEGKTFDVGTKKDEKEKRKQFPD